MKYLSLSFFIFVAGCSTGPKRSAQENLDGLVKALHADGLRGANSYFEQNKQFIEYPYKKWMLFVGKREGMSGQGQQYVTLDDIKRKFANHTRMIKNAKNSCTSNKLQELKECSESFKEQGVRAVLEGFWVTQSDIDTVVPVIKRGVKKYEVKLTEKKEQSQSQQDEISQRFKRQRKLCKSKGIKFMADVTARIEENVGGGFFNARLIGVNKYLCGQQIEIARILPKVFVLSGMKKPKPQTCATIVIRSIGEKVFPDKRGFKQKWTVWKPATKDQVTKNFYVNPSWGYCP